MSLGYAEKLSYRDDLGGQLGAPEIFDEAEALAANAQQLADMVSTAGPARPDAVFSIQQLCALNCVCHMQIRASNAVIVFTGAGISTACGIPDFRWGIYFSQHTFRT